MQANDGVWRVSELQKEVAHLKQELHKRRLAAQQAADDLTQLQVSACLSVSSYSECGALFVMYSTGGYLVVFWCLCIVR